MGSEDLESPNFYEARLRRSETVFVGGLPTVVKTFSCLDHLIFEKCRQAYVIALQSSTAELEDRFNSLVRLLDASKTDWRRAAPTELPDLLLALIRVNPMPPPLAWQTSSTKPKAGVKKDEPQDEDAISYEGRQLAALVATLADTFKWTADYILDDLTLYEFNCYVQEALLTKHAAQEALYNMSDIGFEKVGENYKKVPFPEPSWTKKQVSDKEVELVKQAAQVKAPAGFMPDGVVYDFTKRDEKGNVLVVNMPVVDKNQQVESVPDKALVK